jgi:hypothetical protein
MKNIHLVPTDKATGIFESNNNLHFSIIEKVRSGRDRMFKGYHIYITSEEEIKDNDWFLLDMSHSDILPDEIHQMGGNKRSKTGGINFSEPNSWTKGCKKIILTTDQDLITDGVQSINDEFLGWYTKNSSCESVEVKHFGTCCGNQSINQCINCEKYNPIYKLIIPQEEPKQETVEEAAEKWVFETNGHKWSNDDDTAGDNYGSFREGAKWMLEKLQDFDTWKEWKDINFK